MQRELISTESPEHFVIIAGRGQRLPQTFTLFFLPLTDNSSDRRLVLSLSPVALSFLSLRYSALAGIVAEWTGLLVSR